MQPLCKLWYTVALELCQPRGAELIPPLMTKEGQVFLIRSILF